MNRLLLVLAASLILIVPWLLPPSAVAGPNEGGTLILHRNQSLVYTADYDYCAESGLSSCEDAVVTAPADPDSTVVFHVLAAFPAGASPRLKGLVFGIDYDPERLILVDRGACAGFELPDGDWPAPGSGTSVVLDEVSTDLLTPVYWFSAAAYSFGDTASFALVPHATQGGEFGDDAVPSVLDPIADYGRLGFGTPGFLPCPGDGDEPGGDGPVGGGDVPQGGEGEEGGGDSPEGVMGTGHAGILKIVVQ